MMLEDFKIKDLPETVFCIPNFVSQSEEELLLKRIYEAPKVKWTNLLNRRLQNWGGLPKEKGMLSEPIPRWLHEQIDKIQDLGIFETTKIPNHVLINEYQAGQGISPHLDGNLFHPIIATISLGSHTVLNYYEPLQSDLNEHCSSLDSRLKFKLYVPQRSLLLVKNQMFSHYLHGIEEIRSDYCDTNLIIPNQCQFSQDHDDSANLERKTRISLTIRHVPNTKKIKIKF